MDERYDSFVREHGAALLEFAYLLCRDRSRAEDLVQESLVKALKAWRRGAEVEFPAAYVRRIVVHEYIGWRRRRTNVELVGLPEVDQVEPDGASERAERDLMWQLLGELSPRARAVLVLRYYEALPDREIAAVLGCAE